MIRTILKSEKNWLKLDLPDDMVGKTIEVIAFEIEQPVSSPDKSNEDKSAKIAALDNAMSKYRVDLSNFKFDRDEANDYD